MWEKRVSRSCDTCLFGTKYKVRKNTVLVSTFWDHGQFSLYILVDINLVPIILT